MRYAYIKAVPSRFNTSRVALSATLAGIGSLLLLWVLYPILSFSLLFAKSTSNLISPLPDSIQIHLSDRSSAETLGVSTVDYTKASNWFPQNKQENNSTVVDTYILSIPKLKIKGAQVTIGSDDLNKSLIHYGGTGIPGKYGNTVIFGHSVLPTFYNPKDYKTIFSTLPSLKEGDEIEVTYDNVFYRYVVESMVVTAPDDVSGLEQKYDDSYITLVTCVPPGTYWKRLWIKALLKKD